MKRSNDIQSLSKLRVRKSPGAISPAIKRCAVVAALGVTPLFSGVAAALELPVFELKTAVVDEQKAVALLNHIQGEKQSGFKVSEINRAVNYDDGVHTVQTYRASGGHFIADRAQLWNADAKPELPEPAQALEIANEFVTKFDLLPKENDWINVAFSGYSETGIGADVPNGIDKRVLDIHANYSVSIKLDSMAKKMCLLSVAVVISRSRSAMVVRS